MLAVILIQCAVQKKTTYDIPSYLPAERKTELLGNLEKGRILFKTNCSGCHGIFTKGKDSIPNFTEKEIVTHPRRQRRRSRSHHRRAATRRDL